MKFSEIIDDLVNYVTIAGYLGSVASIVFLFKYKNEDDRKEKKIKFGGLILSVLVVISLFGLGVFFRGKENSKSDPKQEVHSSTPNYGQSSLTSADRPRKSSTSDKIGLIEGAEKSGAPVIDSDAAKKSYAAVKSLMEFTSVTGIIDVRPNGSRPNVHAVVEIKLRNTSNVDVYIAWKRYVDIKLTMGAMTLDHSLGSQRRPQGISVCMGSTASSCLATAPNRVTLVPAGEEAVGILHYDENYDLAELQKFKDIKKGRLGATLFVMPVGGNAAVDATAISLSNEVELDNRISGL